MCKVLLVDDNPDDLEIIRRTIQRAAPDSEVTQAETLHEAVTRLDEDGGYDLIITDMVFPVGDGKAIQQYAARRAPNAQVVLTSSIVDDFVVRRMGIKRGKFLEKDQLLEEIPDLLREAEACRPTPTHNGRVRNWARRKLHLTPTTG